MSVKVTPLGLYRYGNSLDRLLMVVGFIFALIDGAGPAFMSLIFGGLANNLIDTVKYGFTNSSVPLSNNTQIPGPSLTPSEFQSIIGSFSILYIALGLAIYLASSTQITCWQVVCERVVFRCRRNFLRSILRQDLTWFDEHQSGSLSAKLNDDVERIRDGIGEQTGMFIKQVSSFFAAFIIGFIVSWRLTLVILMVTPILALFSAYLGKTMATSSLREQEKYASAGAIGEELLVAVRTVFALNGQHKGIQEYKKRVMEGKTMAQTKYIKMSLSFGASFLVLYSSYGLALYVASLLISDNQLDPGSAMSVIMAVMIGANSLGNLLPPLQAITQAISSATLVYNVIDNVPPIDPYSDRGLRLSRVMASIKFEKVCFTYPTRPGVPILSNLSFEIHQGKTVAICGRTGSGKSTIMNLLLRFYDPTSGSIYLDNCDLRDLNVSWLRSLIGIVEQEPALFDCSIHDNIALGAIRESDKSRKRVVEAAKLANADEFICSLPESYETRCGDRGVQLSGGQKQRIAIARALLGDPKILLLDEATSALDSANESIVQAALNKARQGRTTIIIAHRLSTIKEADIILVLDQGRVAEMGKHDELMEKRGDYHQLVTNQLFYDKSESDNEEEDDDRSSHRGNMLYDSQAESESTGQLRQRSFSRMQSVVSNLERAISSRSDRSSKDPLIPKSGTFDQSLSTSHQSISDRRKPYTTTLYESINRPLKNSAELIEAEKIELNQKDLPGLIDLLRLMKNEMNLVIIGSIASILSGFLLPTFGVFYAQILDTLSRTGDELIQYATFWGLMFVALGFANFIALALRIYLLANTIETALARVRVECFTNILRQQVGWFDLPSHSPQRLTTRLASDAPAIKSVFNTRIGSLISGVSTIVASLLIAFYLGWKLAFLLMIFLPFLLYFNYLQMRITRSNKIQQQQRMEEASRLATEAVEHVKIIQAINKEIHFCDKFNAHLTEPLADSLSAARKFGLIYGVSQSCIYFVYAASFYWGGYLIATGQMDAITVFRVFFSVAFTAITVGQWGGIGGDYNRARESLARVLKLLKSPSSIDNLSRGGIKPKFKGSVTLRDVYFNYPSRPDMPVLQGLNLTVRPGQTVALVGPSGNGKSTIAALLLRFYDPNRGAVLIDDFDVRCINLNHLRHNVGLVSQEPCLFKASIKENILYGLDRSRYSMREIIQAAKLANIHEFISSLPLGYDTQVGDQGCQISGGQKQRIAIARTLIRNPTILILDEATSALDAENEKLVDDALIKAAKGKTCIKIAHRLSTVRDADLIAVMDQGSIVELGTHEELMSNGNKGFYYKLMQRQDISA